MKKERKELAQRMAALLNEKVLHMGSEKDVEGLAKVLGGWLKERD